MQEQDLEIQLWDYIDNNCSSEDRVRISELLATNDVWKNKYKELLAIHQSLKTNIELKKVSPAFTASTMKQISPSTPQKLKPFFTWGTQAIVVFFIVATFTFLGYSVSQIDWAASNSILPDWKLNFTEDMPISYLVFGILLFGLLCIDQLLKRRATGL